jgi:hypothetical protein
MGGRSIRTWSGSEEERTGKVVKLEAARSTAKRAGSTVTMDATDTGLAIVTALGRCLSIGIRRQSGRTVGMNRERYGVPQAVAETPTDVQKNNPSGPMSEMSLYLHLKISITVT